jgi:hypothetical protein
VLKALELFDELDARGARFEAVAGELHVTAPCGVLTDELKQEIAVNKDVLLDVVGLATVLLNRYGVRLIGGAVGMWRVADRPEVRRALKAVGLGAAEVRYLDDPDADVPDRYREFVPLLIQQIWDDERVLGTPEERIEAERKARRINAVFDQLGAFPHSSQITADTVLHGMLAHKRKP